MRMSKGQPFVDTPAGFAPADWDDKQNPPPTFSEAFLYETVIAALGPRAVNRLLSVKPKLAQRLGVGGKLVEWLDDAMPDEALRHEERVPPEIVLDHEAAIKCWELLHGEYQRQFNPEQTMGRDKLRAYNTLTEALGGWAVSSRQKERDKLPEKLKRQEAQRARLEARKARRGDVDAIIANVLSIEDVKDDHGAIARAIRRALEEEADGVV